MVSSTRSVGIDNYTHSVIEGQVIPLCKRGILHQGHTKKGSEITTEEKFPLLVGLGNTDNEVQGNRELTGKPTHCPEKRLFRHLYGLILVHKKMVV